MQGRKLLGAIGFCRVVVVGRGLVADFGVSNCIMTHLIIDEQRMGFQF